MKKIIVFLLLLFSVFHSFAQEDTSRYIKYPNSNGIQYPNIWSTKILRIPFRDTSALEATPAAIQFGLDSLLYFWNGTKWGLVQTQTDSSVFVTYSKIIDTLNNFISNQAFTDSLSGYVKIDTQNPTATASSSPLIYEKTSASTISVNVNWTSGRLASLNNAFATNPLSTIVVGGVSQTFSQPSPGSTVLGTQAVTINTNTTTTLSNITTTTDGKTASQSFNILFQDKVYAGFVTSSSPNSSAIIAATGSSYVGGQFSTNRKQTGSLSTPSGTQYYAFASPVSSGVPVITINGAGVSLIQTIISFTNSSGQTSNYYLEVSPFPTAGAIDTYTVN